MRRCRNGCVGILGYSGRRGAVYVFVARVPSRFHTGVAIARRIKCLSQKRPRFYCPFSPSGGGGRVRGFWG